MKQFNDLKGKLVKGRDLPKTIFVKVTNSEMDHHDFPLVVGENVDKHELMQKDCSEGGIYFCPFEELHRFTMYGDGFHIVQINPNEDVWVEEEKCKARTIVLSEKVLFAEMDLAMCMLLAAQNGHFINHMSAAMKNNPVVCEIAVRQNEYSIRHMSEEMRSNKRICEIAVRKNWYTIEFMNKTMRNDADIVGIVAEKFEISIDDAKRKMREYMNGLDRDTMPYVKFENAYNQAVQAYQDEIWRKDLIAMIERIESDLLK
jgi:hypothetical protein